MQELAALHAIVLKEVPRRIELILEESSVAQDFADYGSSPEEVEEKAKEWLDKVETLLDFVGKSEIRLAKQDIKFNEGLEMDGEYFQVCILSGIVVFCL